LIALTDKITPQRLIQAYQPGFFPWYSEGATVLWWFTVTKNRIESTTLSSAISLRKKNETNYAPIPIREIQSQISAFADVIHACANGL
jgi:leucyl/phenylalanyl-tRNA--protein transferase